MGYVFDDCFISDYPVEHEIVMPFHEIDTVISHCGSEGFVIKQWPTARCTHQVDNGRPEIGMGVVRRLLSAVVEYTST